MNIARPLRNMAAALLAAAASTLAAAQAPASAGSPRTVVVTGFELIESHPNPDTEAADQRRLAAAERQLREGLVERGLYRVLPPEAGRETRDRLRGEHALLHECVECPQLIGQAAGSELVLLGWVQKVSELILNMNVELRETATDRVLLNKSVDLRGNNDQSWQRGLNFMLRDWAERRARDPRYGH